MTEIKRGCWYMDEYGDILCSACGAGCAVTTKARAHYERGLVRRRKTIKTHNEYLYTKYCPSCGARMDKEERPYRNGRTEVRILYKGVPIEYARIEP